MYIYISCGFNLIMTFTLWEWSRSDLLDSITFKASILQHHSAAAALVRLILGDRMSSFLVSWSFLTNYSHWMTIWSVDQKSFVHLLVLIILQFLVPGFHNLSIVLIALWKHFTRKSDKIYVCFYNYLLFCFYWSMMHGIRQFGIRS